MNLEPSTSQKRVSIACETCRKRKRKCDGAQPTCSSCRGQNKECRYEALEDITRKRKRNLDYVVSIEEQLATLKAYVRDLERRNQNEVDMPYLGSQGPSLQNHSRVEADFEPGTYEDLTKGDSLDSDTFQDQGNRLASAIDEVGSLMWKMSINDAGNASFIGPSGNFCFTTSSSVVQKNASVQGTNPTINGDTLYNIYSKDRHLRTELLELFATSINTFHQFVPSGFFTSTAFDNSDPGLILLHCAMLAASSRLSTRKDAERIGECFAEHAESLALRCCRDSPSLLAVQALTIMCWRELSLENENMAWMYNSMAASLCIHMGLHVGALEYLNSDSQSIPSTMNGHESRVRTFWQFFLVDRMATSMLGRQCTIPWKRVKTLPFNSILYGSSTLEEIAFDHQCRLWLLHDQFMDQIYSFEFPTLSFFERNKLLMDAREKLISFHRSIDDRLRFNKVVLSGYTACFQMSYQMSLLLIHRPYLRESPESGLHQLALRSMTAAASAMTSLVRSYRKLDGFRRAPFYVVHHIHTAAIMHLLSATSLHTMLRQQSITRFRICIEALEDLQATWPRARKSIRLMQELAKKWSVVSALPMRFSNLLDIEVATSHAETQTTHGVQVFFGKNNSATAGRNEHALQQIDYDSNILEWEETIFGEEDTGNAPWMDPNTFNNLAISNDPFGILGLAGCPTLNDEVARAEPMILLW